MSSRGRGRGADVSGRGRGQKSPPSNYVNTPKIQKEVEQKESYLFEMEIELQNGSKKPLFIKKEDNSKQLAEKFCNENNMSEMSEALAFYIDENLKKFNNGN